ncbi:MAG: DNA methylase [Ruminococcus sp.]|nr:DNA methylase [Ruminococcus sp.]
MGERQYIAIDLKSFYASVECVNRGLDPLTANLVVADKERTVGTICLAVSPSLKAYGIPGRARMFEVVQKVRDVNAVRRITAPNHKLVGKSYIATELSENPALELDYIVAKPQMAHYMKVSTEIYKIYLKYVAPEDIHVYSIDEVFIDATNYLNTRNITAHELAMTMVRDVLRNTGITATAGIGTNLYLSKVAMDIVAKRMPADSDGVRIAQLDEMSYRRELWEHRPLTDFWRVGRGYSNKLKKYGMYTMGDIALCSLNNEGLLYQLFGINAELLIDHAWGWEPCRISDIKSYTPSSKSLSQGQVLGTPYNNEKARLIIREMTEILVLDLVDKELLTDQVVLTVGYDIENLKNEERKNRYKGEVTVDHYGRRVPKQTHGSENIGRFTSSTKLIVDAVLRLFDRITDKDLLVRRMYVVANHTVFESTLKDKAEQLDLFTDFGSLSEEKMREDRELSREKNIQKTVISLKKRYGKNAVLKGMNLKEGATARDRNRQIGGHRA